MVRALAAILLPLVVPIAVVAFDRPLLDGPRAVLEPPRRELVWGGERFGSQPEFERWLHARDVAYDEWAERHPGAVPWERRARPRDVLAAWGAASLLALLLVSRPRSLVRAPTPRRSRPSQPRGAPRRRLRLGARAAAGTAAVAARLSAAVAAVLRAIRAVVSAAVRTLAALVLGSASRARTAIRVLGTGLSAAVAAIGAAVSASATTLGARAGEGAAALRRLAGAVGRASAAGLEGVLATIGAAISRRSRAGIAFGGVLVRTGRRRTRSAAHTLAGGVSTAITTIRAAVAAAVLSLAGVVAAAGALLRPRRFERPPVRLVSPRRRMQVPVVAALQPLALASAAAVQAPVRRRVRPAAEPAPARAPRLPEPPPEQELPLDEEPLRRETAWVPPDRSVPPAAEPAPDEALEPEGGYATGEESCEIVLWRGYVKEQFWAFADDGNGGSTAIAASPLFRTRRGSPDSGQARAAHEELVRHLCETGWEPSGSGDEWFSTRFARTGRDARSS